MRVISDEEFAIDLPKGLEKQKEEEHGMGGPMDLALRDQSGEPVEVIPEKLKELGEKFSYVIHFVDKLGEKASSGEVDLSSLLEIIEQDTMDDLINFVNNARKSLAEMEPVLDRALGKLEEADRKIGVTGSNTFLQLKASIRGNSMQTKAQLVNRSSVIERIEAIADSDIILEEMFGYFSVAELEQFADHLEDTYGLGLQGAMTSTRVVAADVANKKAQDFTKYDDKALLQDPDSYGDNTLYGDDAFMTALLDKLNELQQKVKKSKGDEDVAVYEEVYNLLESIDTILNPGGYDGTV